MPMVRERLEVQFENMRALPDGRTIAAKVAGLWVTVDGVSQRINHVFGEHWGHDRAEARARLEASVDKWIEVQND
jgi:hypothetical protein